MILYFMRFFNRSGFAFHAITFFWLRQAPGKVFTGFVAAEG